jgi:hypothetical protein
MEREKQLELGELLKQSGMKASEDNANKHNSRWSDDAFDYLIVYILEHDDSFMAEDIREFARKNGLPDPPSKRAWGSVISRAKKTKIIKFHSYDQVSNPRAHRANAVRWVVFGDIKHNKQEVIKNEDNNKDSRGQL